MLMCYNDQKEREIEADPDNQKKIEEGIYHKLVNENFENAIEHNPEVMHHFYNIIINV